MGDYITARPELIPYSIIYSKTPPSYVKFEVLPLVPQTSTQPPGEIQNEIQDEIQVEATAAPGEARDSLILQRMASSLPPKPSQPMSAQFAYLRNKLTKTWHTLEAAERSLTSFDDISYAKLKDYVSGKMKGVTQQAQLEREKARLTKTLLPPMIEEVEKLISQVAVQLQQLQQMAQVEKNTIEGMAAIEIDVPVLEKCLEATRGIVEASKAQVVT